MLNFQGSIRKQVRWRLSNYVTIGAAAGIVLILSAAAPVAHAQRAETRIAGPFFHQESNSYYELHRIPGFSHRNNWEYVRRLAAQMTYKNARGNLAIVDSAAVHQFLVQMFEFPGPTWIGLRYFCATNKLIWIDWKEHKRSAFAFWHQQWAGDPRVTCLNQNNLTYMGAYYVGGGDFRWRLQGEKKAYPWFLVQYRMSN